MPHTPEHKDDMPSQGKDKTGKQGQMGQQGQGSMGQGTKGPGGESDWQSGTDATKGTSSWQDPTATSETTDTGTKDWDKQAGQNSPTGGSQGAGMGSSTNQQPDPDREEFRERNM
jgi:hypothetical protein